MNLRRNGDMEEQEEEEEGMEIIEIQNSYIIF